MSDRSTIELKDWVIPTDIGTYAPGDTVPDAHVLDLTLWISPALVLIPEDGMSHVFDYDPLVLEIERLAADGHYETQERLMTRIAEACARCVEVEAVEVALRKSPVRNGSGSLGVRVHVGQDRLRQMREREAHAHL